MEWMSMQNICHVLHKYVQCSTVPVYTRCSHASSISTTTAMNPPEAVRGSWYIRHGDGDGGDTGGTSRGEGITRESGGLRNGGLINFWGAVRTQSNDRSPSNRDEVRVTRGNWQDNREGLSSSDVHELFSHGSS